LGDVDKARNENVISDGKSTFLSIISQKIISLSFLVFIYQKSSSYLNSTYKKLRKYKNSNFVLSQEFCKVCNHYMKFILGKKIGMTQVFLQNGLVVPVTKVQAGPCQIVAVNEDVKNGVKAVQIGFDETKESRLAKPQVGHLKDLDKVRNLRNFKIENSASVKRGDTITVDTFIVGDKVQVVGESKGKGFAGVVKRHHFRGGPASHGHKDNLRMPGSIGAGGVQRVFKGMRMGGRMGGDRITIKNLEIVEVHPENGEIYIKGAVPGGRNALLLISAEGELKLAENAMVAAVAAPEEQVAAVEQINQ